MWQMQDLQTIKVLNVQSQFLKIAYVNQNTRKQLYAGNMTKKNINQKKSKFREQMNNMKRIVKGERRKQIKEMIASLGQKVIPQMLVGKKEKTSISDLFISRRYC